MAYNAGRRQSHSFSQVPAPRLPRSRFNRSHKVSTTFDVGKIIPVFYDEVLPGDTISLTPRSFCRLATPLHPILDQVNLDIHFFAVPLRLIWANFEKAFGAQDDPGDSTSFVTPKVTLSGFDNTIYDYMGIAPGGGSTVHNLGGRAYNLIWNEWFRDQNLQDSAVVDTDDGPDTEADYFAPLPRGKYHDYFASAMTAPQKGTAVELTIGPIQVAGDGIPQFEMVGPGASSGHPYHLIHSDTAGGAGEVADFNVATNTGGVTDARMKWTDPKLETAFTTINELRTAFQIQKMFERDMRGGTRYTEIIRSHFGVVSPDARLQRPEYLGQFQTPIKIHAVPQTSETNTTPQGTLTAYGLGARTGRTITRSFTEHCIVLGLASARPTQTYQQGIPREFLRDTRFDFFWPSFQHLGEQEILAKEIYTDGTGNDDNIFGYQERYAEYRYKQNMVTGKMRSDASGSLDTWHVAEDFASHPTLNSTFIEVDDTGVERTMAVPSEPHLILDCHFTYLHTRCMATYGVPGLVDHF